MPRRLINLLDETNKFLQFYNKTLSDVKYIFGNDYQITVDNFVEVASKSYYDSSLGFQEIAKDLVMVGDDFYATRYEFEGNEGWEHHPMNFTIPETISKVSKLSGGMWNTLSEINEEKLDK